MTRRSFLAAGGLGLAALTISFDSLWQRLPEAVPEPKHPAQARYWLTGNARCGCAATPGLMHLAAV